MKILIEISYDGTSYSGWQIQPNADTVQERIENAIKNLTGETVRVTGSGRTDAGVHAERQVAHFETESTLPPEKFKNAINSCLPEDIRVISSRAVPENFHAVKSAKKKTYVYTVLLKENPLLTRYAYFSGCSLDLSSMKRAAKLFVGTHNFKGFSATGGSAKTFERTIYSFKIKKVGEKITFTITGNGFLYKMVRMIVGACVLAGQRKITLQEIKVALLSCEKPKNALTLPAKGLCLAHVVYPEFKKK